MPQIHNGSAQMQSKGFSAEMIRQSTVTPMLRRIWAEPGSQCRLGPFVDARGRIASGSAGAGGGGGAP
jgi:hypothetical protein